MHTLASLVERRAAPSASQLMALARGKTVSPSSRLAGSCRTARAARATAATPLARSTRASCGRWMPPAACRTARCTTSPRRRGSAAPPPSCSARAACGCTWIRFGRALTVRLRRLTIGLNPVWGACARSRGPQLAQLRAQTHTTTGARHMWTPPARIAPAAARAFFIPLGLVSPSRRWRDRSLARSQIFFKEAGDHQTFWHADVGMFPLLPRAPCVSAWIPLRDLPSNAGALKVRSQHRDATIVVTCGVSATGRRTEERGLQSRVLK